MDPEKASAIKGTRHQRKPSRPWAYSNKDLRELLELPQRLATHLFFSEISQNTWF